tara:strand:+ start:440 stop:1027 length:588 start_codon:yes stop_codon:yes gene_type:complete
LPALLAIAGTLSIIMQGPKIFAIITILLLCLNSVGQEIVGVKDIYFENELAYKILDNHRFTGIAQKVRKNGHVIYEETFDDGVILTFVVYYNGRDKEISEKMFYNRYKTFVPEKNIKYITNKKGKSEQIEYYDEDGLKILEETITEGITTYRCEFLNGKKHGQEFCFDDDGNELIIKYINGKKLNLILNQTENNY